MGIAPQGNLVYSCAFSNCGRLAAALEVVSEWSKEHAWTMCRMHKCRGRKDAGSGKCVTLFRPLAP